MAKAKTKIHSTVKESAKARRLINRFAGAAVANSWKGSSHPDNWDDIKQEYESAGRALKRYIAELEGKQPKIVETNVVGTYARDSSGRRLSA